MSHRHYCDFSGHFWPCEGAALRPLAGDTEPSVCMCDNCHVPMELGDHSGCMIELLACPEHMDEQLREMGYEPGTSNMPRPSGDTEAPVFTDSDGNPIVGFCLWCNKDFYSFEEGAAHEADGSAACSVFQKYKNEGLLDGGDGSTEPGEDQE